MANKRMNKERRLFLCAAFEKEARRYLDDASCERDLQFAIVEEKFKRYEEALTQSPSLEEEWEREEDARTLMTTISVMQRGRETKETASSTVDTAVKFPKVEFIKFDLSPKTWISFWSQFENVHLNNKLTVNQKFCYLMQCTKEGTRGRRVVESYPPNAANYVKVIEALKNRFGRTTLIIEYYTTELLDLILVPKKPSLSVLYDSLSSKIRALESLGVTSDNFSAVLYPLVHRALPQNVAIEWERHRSRLENGTDNVSDSATDLLANPLNELLSFLEQEVLSVERLAMSHKKTPESNRVNSNLSNEAHIATAAALTSNTVVNCVFCDADHPSYKCEKAKDMSYDDKIEKLQMKRRCFRCFGNGHSSKFCRRKIKCGTCGKGHSELLCKGSTTPVPSLHAGMLSLVFLKTLLVKVNGRLVRALLDDGASRSYIREDLANELNLKSVGTEYTSHTLFGGLTTNARAHKKYEIVVYSTDKTFSHKMSFLETKKICCDIPRVRDEEVLKALEAKGIYLTDTGTGDPEIEMLIGAQALGSIMKDRNISLGCGVTAIETKFGWCVIGSKKPMIANARNVVNHCLFVEEKLWSLRELGIESPNDNCNEMQIVSVQFENSIKINDDGRYEVKLPWRAGHPTLSSHKKLAELRLHGIKKKLGDKIKDYVAVFSDWEKEGFIERVVSESLSERTHYLPHRPVYRPDSLSTKIRPVFDASAREAGSVSLNECLFAGPNLLKSIPEILTRFRAGKIGVTSDIKQAFLQISLNEGDRDSLRFLSWDPNDMSRLITYRHTRVVFGVSSSPYLLNATLGHHFSRSIFDQSKYSETIEILKRSFYCDDCVTSLDSSEKLAIFMIHASEILALGKFELTKWCHSESEISKNQTSERVKTVLGIQWDLESDTLYCAKPSIDVLRSDVPLTKRGLLSLVSRVFDPLGFLCPALLTLKLQLQRAWIKKIDWDEQLPVDMLNEFSRWKQSVDKLENCVVPRYFHNGASYMSCCEFHVFADGSANAYACCIYVRCTFSDQISVNLVAGKARVVPPEKLTIPRIELLAALIAVRLVNSLSLPKDVRVSYWSDSSVALAWITKSIPWKTWVGNRVSEIREHTNVHQWGHVDGASNPADLPSRGCDIRQLLETSWFHGPKWLYKNQSEWPCKAVANLYPDEARLEEKIVNLTMSVISSEFKINLTHYFSNYIKLLRMVAWMLRFAHNCKLPREAMKGALSVSELNKAENVLCRIVQSDWHDREKQTVLKLEEGNDGLIRVNTRLDCLSDETENFKRPIVLIDHPITIRLIEYLHRTNGHAGCSTLLGIVREKYWILRGRKLIKRVLGKCVRCRRFSSKHVIPPLAPLPRERLEKCAAFSVTGVDLGGPLLLKNQQKAWFVLFTCAVYRAVHIELVTSLSTESFLLALRRFFARRGRCAILWSDRGTNFCGAAAQLNKLDWVRIVEESALQKIEWRFNPAAAPWWGGWWERLIGVVKTSLKKILGRASLNYEELLTVLADCESVVNRRPLTYVSDNEDDFKVLTPWMFLCELSEPRTVDLDKIDSCSLVKRLQYISRVRESLRNRFRVEYIGALASRPYCSRGELRVGDIVLVGSDNKKRVEWPLAKIVELIKGRDGEARVCKLKLQGGELIRAVQRVYPLEISGPEEIENIDSHSLKQPDVPAVVPIAKPIETRVGRQVKKPNRLDL